MIPQAFRRASARRGWQPADASYTGRPSLAHAMTALGARAVALAMSPVGGMLAVVPRRIPILLDGTPPFFVKHGLHTETVDFAGMPVTRFTPRRPSGTVVVAVHGGAYVGEATLFHWWAYADLARDTDATVVAPRYTLSPEGTAATEVPRMADLIAHLIEEYGAERVGVLGDSAGGGLALLAVQELIRRKSATPGRLVLVAPWLDVSTSDPRCAQIDDPLLDIAHMTKDGRLWAGAWDVRDPRVSPLYGPLRGLPPTAVYSSSRDILTIDALNLRDRVVAEGIPDVTFRFRAGLLHDYVIYAPLPEARAERPNLYQDLGA